MHVLLLQVSGPISARNAVQTFSGASELRQKLANLKAASESNTL